jgi:hypothetical protein
VNHAADNRESQDRVTLLGGLLFAVVATGVLARAVRYVGAWPLWDDEAALAVNFAKRGYLELVQPLEQTQVAPIGFLWTVRALVDLFGFNEYSLRLIPFIASVLTLLLVIKLSRMVILNHGWEFTVAVLAATAYQIRYAAELKPYAVDSFWGALLVVLALLTVRRGPGSAVALLLLTPIALLSSLPAAFVAGGIAIALALPLMRSERVAWKLYPFVLGLVVLAVSGAHYKFVLSRQMAAHHDRMADHWHSAFVDLSSPLALAWWILETATGVVFAIPLGGRDFGSIVSGILFWVGIVALCRQRQWDFLRILGGVALLALIASALKLYPFGGHARVVQYLAPMLSVAIGAGICAGLNLVQRHRQVWRNGALIVLLTVVIFMILRDVAKPQHGFSPREYRNFARWFWGDYRDLASLRCVNAAWHDTYHPPSGGSQHYECFREMYAPDLEILHDAIPRDIRSRIGLVVLTREYADDKASLEKWKSDLSQNYEVIWHDVFPVNSQSPSVDEQYHVVWVQPRERLEIPEPSAAVSSMDQ